MKIKEMKFLWHLLPSVAAVAASAILSAVVAWFAGMAVGALALVVIASIVALITAIPKVFQPLMGDYATDLVRNRAKRIFNDRTGSRCGSNHEYLTVLQGVFACTDVVR